MKALLNFAQDMQLVYNSKFTGSLEVKESLDQEAKDFSFLSYSTISDTGYTLKAYQCFYKYPYLIYSCPKIFLQCLITEIEYILQANVGQSAAEAFVSDLLNCTESFIEWLGYILQYYGYSELSSVYTDPDFIKICVVGCKDNLFSYSGDITTMQFGIAVDEEKVIDTIPLPTNTSIDLGALIIDTYLLLLQKTSDYKDSLKFVDVLKGDYLSAWQEIRKTNRVDSFEDSPLSKINDYIQKTDKITLGAINDMLISTELANVVEDGNGDKHIIISLTTFREIQSVRGIHNYLKNYDYLDVVITPTKAVELSIRLPGQPVRNEVEWGHFLDQIQACIPGDFKVYDKQASKYIILHVDILS